MELTSDASFLLLAMLVAISVVWITNKLFQEWRSPLWKIPGPPTLPIVGQMFEFLKEKDHTKVLREWSKTYGPILTYKPGFGRTRVLLSEPELVKQVLVTNCLRYGRPAAPAVCPIPGLTESLFFSNGKEHARQRRMISPAFHHLSIRTMMQEPLKRVANSLVKAWSDKLANSATDWLEVNAQEDLTHLTLDVIGICAFGFDFNTVLSGDSQVSRAFTDLTHFVNFGYLLRITLIPFYKYLPFEENTKLRDAQKLAVGTVIEIIYERRKAREKDAALSKRDALDLLMDMYDEETDHKMADEDLVAHVFTLLFAGHETTSVSLAWTLYELARHPDIEHKLRQEIKAVFADNCQLCWDKLEDLEYLGCVINESLRLHPPAPTASRVVLQEDHVGGFQIPAGAVVTMAIDVIHHSEKFWPDPFEFKPERFLRKEGEPSCIKPYTFFPFSSGPRTCLGYRFALITMKVTLATLIQRFHFTEVPGCTFKPLMQLTARPHPPLRLRISPPRLDTAERHS